ncbi:hypothetical protein GCM10022243_37250 [Saccharothrix violaceirubra]|uniref:Uncharacterized protein n=1 Tax=Saccharothrix violaceirubra TaxID=413306 RepID=A0A7W7T4C6_9PSEU|nr:hypothetical protein [Saccharothrix violaceirubra]MBB4966359.1 hypothetical protein [Saccharothrix violaceirubra]
MRKTPHVTLRPSWCVGPLWIRWSEGIAEPHDADEAAAVLGLDDDLRAAITAWDERFQATFDPTYPPDSAFPTSEDEAAWLTEGRRLALRLRAALPHLSVDHETIGGRAVPLDEDTPL